MVQGCFEMQKNVLASWMWKHFSHALAIEFVVQFIIDMETESSLVKMDLMNKILWKYP